MNVHGFHWCLVGLASWLAIGGLSSAREEAERSDPSADASPASRAPILESWKADFGDRSVILNRRAPAAASRSPRPPESPAALSPAAAALLEDSPKKTVFLRLSTTVRDHRVTEVRWFSEGSQHRILSNIDFNHLAGLGHFETDDAVYLLYLGLGNENEARRAKVDGGWRRRGASLAIE